jgi:hypothetical protein
MDGTASGEEDGYVVSPRSPSTRLFLNMLLDQEGIDPADVRLLRHQDARSAKGRSPYALWRDDRASFERYQSRQSFAHKTRLAAPYWASFVVTPDGSTLLAGFYAATYRGTLEADEAWPHGDGIDLAGSCDVFELSLDPRISDLAGRLVIEWGPGVKSWIQRADLQNKPILELQRAFREPDFPGALAFVSPLSKIEALPPSWIAALSTIRGVYLLTCPRTREQYVGAAYGERGFVGRWRDYVANAHGGNVVLKSRDPSDYQVAILEVAGSAATVTDVIAMEMRWKEKLQSRAMGLNRN